eukprot:1154747-Pelagomonas_calceolata.AAC.4
MGKQMSGPVQFPLLTRHGAFEPCMACCECCCIDAGMACCDCCYIETSMACRDCRGIEAGMAPAQAMCA